MQRFFLDDYMMIGALVRPSLGIMTVITVLTPIRPRR